MRSGRRRSSPTPSRSSSRAKAGLQEDATDAVTIRGRVELVRVQLGQFPQQLHVVAGDASVRECVLILLSISGPRADACPPGWGGRATSGGHAAHVGWFSFGLSAVRSVLDDSPRSRPCSSRCDLWLLDEDSNRDSAADGWVPVNRAYPAAWRVHALIRILRGPALAVERPPTPQNGASRGRGPLRCRSPFVILIAGAITER